MNQTEKFDTQKFYKFSFLASTTFVIIVVVMFSVTIYQFQVGINSLIQGQIEKAAQQIGDVTERYNTSIIYSETISNQDLKVLTAKISQQQKTLEELNTKIAQQQEILKALKHSMKLEEQ